MTTVINFKTDAKIKNQAQKVAEAMGLSLSDVLNVYLRGFVRVKKLCIDLNEDESKPSKELLEAIKEAREEQKSGKMKGFKNMNAALDYLATI